MNKRTKSTGIKSLFTNSHLSKHCARHRDNRPEQDRRCPWLLSMRGMWWEKPSHSNGQTHWEFPQQIPLPRLSSIQCPCTAGNKAAISGSQITKLFLLITHLYVQSPVPLGLIKAGKLELNTFISITFSILFWVAHYSSQCVEIATCFFVSVVQSHAGELWLTKKSGFRT